MKWCSTSLIAICLSLGFFPTAASTLYVDLNSTNSVSPYTNWCTAATNIQDAVDAATNGDLILVNDGVYETGGRVTPPQLLQNAFVTNRVLVSKLVTLESLNGPRSAIISGSGIYRCVGLTNGAFLSGFTLTNGAAGWIDLTVISANGGGVSGVPRLLDPVGAVRGGVVSNCVLTGNSATGSGGAAYGMTLINCMLTGNYAGLYGGGAAISRLINCVVTGNRTPTNDYSPLWKFGEVGGGIYAGDAINCVIAHNTAWQGGGACAAARLINCTIVSNTATHGGGISADEYGGTASQATNCIIYYNSAGTNANYGGVNIIVHSCTTPMPTAGSGNLTNEPGFVDFSNGNYHLAANSPLINSGVNSAITNSTDLDGNPRIVGGTVDIGTYEYQSPTSMLSYAWARQYGLPTDGTADCADLDCDGMENWQEFVAGTNPTNAASFLAMTSARPNNYLHWVLVQWQSVNTRTYYLLRSSNLAGGFTCISSNIVGNAGTTLYIDGSATNSCPYYYRVGVQ